MGMPRITRKAMGMISRALGMYSDALEMYSYALGLMLEAFA